MVAPGIIFVLYIQQHNVLVIIFTSLIINIQILPPIPALYASLFFNIIVLNISSTYFRITQTLLKFYLLLNIILKTQEKERSTAFM